MSLQAVQLIKDVNLGGLKWSPGLTVSVTAEQAQRLIEEGSAVPAGKEAGLRQCRILKNPQAIAGGRSYAIRS